MKKLLVWLKNKILGIDPRSELEILKDNGFECGDRFHMMGECIIDPGHCWLISVGDRVTLAPRVHILAHDASLKETLGYTKIGKVKIGNDVFIGANTTILPGVTIGDHAVVSSGMTLEKSVPDGHMVRQAAKVEKIDMSALMGAKK